jgi:hypothetical protein
MAVRIPIITVFDSKGLRAAQYQLNKISGNVSNLSRNFAIAGTALAGFGVFLGKSVQQASSLSESINAVNVSFGKSAEGILKFGQTAATSLGVSQVEFNNAAVRFSAFADRIVGAGGDASGFIAEITTRASDFASVFNIEVAEALQVFQSGLAGEAEPLKRFGVNLLDTEVKAFAAANGIGGIGRQLTETEKVQARYGLLMERTNKTAGDFANTSNGLANQLRITKAEVTNTQAEIGNALLPVLQEILPVVRDLILEFGTKLKTAVQNVNWKALITDVVNLLTFLVQNIEAITRLVVVLWTLNTAFNAIKIVVGLTNAALTLFNFALGNTEVAAKKTTGIINGLRTALLLGGVTLAVGSVIDEYRRLQEVIKTSRSPISQFNKEVIAVSGAVAKLDPVTTLWQRITYAILGAVAAQRRFANESPKPDLSGYMDAGERRRNLDVGFAQSGMGNFSLTPSPTSAGGSTSGNSGGSLTSLINAANQNAKVAKKSITLQNKGLSAEVAQWITSAQKPVKAANAAIARISKNGSKAVANLTKSYNKSAAGQAAASAAASAAFHEAQQAAAEAAAAAAQAAAEAAAREAAILAEKQRVYESFANAVNNTFASIKNSIVGAFSLPELGGSTDSIIRNMDKLLARVKSFSQNITKLSSMGLDPTLLQQVIQAGPVAGARLAAGLVAGGSGALARINAGFGEIQGLGSEIGMTGTQSRFGTQTQQNIYNINVEGGVGSGATIGKAIVDAIKAYERTSGAVWQGA